MQLLKGDKLLSILLKKGLMNRYIETVKNNPEKFPGRIFWIITTSEFNSL